MVGDASEIMAGTKLQLANETTVSLLFPDGFKPTAIWIDGNEATNGKATLSAGEHKIVIRCAPQNLPLRMT